MGRIGILSGLVPAAPKMAIRFPSNVSGQSTTSSYGVLEFANPHSNGLPMWGPGGAGVTVYQRKKIYQQTGYYAHFWRLGHATSFQEPNAYWGAHPYPTNAANTGTSHKDEIAAEQDDRFSTRDASEHSTIKSLWVTTAIRVVRNNANSKTFTYYSNLPSVADADVVEYTYTRAGYGESDGPSEMIVVGNSSWFAGYQEERFSGDLAAQLIVAKGQTQAEIVSQSASLYSMTSDSAGSLWHLMHSFASVSDLTCKGGSGRSFTKNDASSILSVVAIS